MSYDNAERYAHGDIECIDAIRAALTPEEFRGYCKGNILKYVWREKYKGGDADLRKAEDYLRWACGVDSRKDPTVEDVLREFANVGIHIAAKDGIKAGEVDFYADEEAIAEYAAKLRLVADEVGRWLNA